MPIAAVVESHHAFDNGDISVLTRPRERLQQLRVAQHPRIEIPARSAGCPFVIARVYIIRSAFEGLDDETTLAKRGDQARGNSGLTDVGRSARDNNARYFGRRRLHIQNSIPACARTFWCFSGCLISVISVTRSARSMISSGALRPVRTT